MKKYKKVNFDIVKYANGCFIFRQYFMLPS